MLGEDLGHGGGAVAAAAVDVGDVEVERGGAPQGAPAAGEGCGAHGVVDGEERYDYAEDLTGERANQIDFLQIRRRLGYRKRRRRRRRRHGLAGWGSSRDGRGPRSE